MDAIAPKMKPKLDLSNVFLVPCACGRSLFEIVSPSIADDKGTTDSGKGRRKHDDGADVQKRVEGRMC